MQKKTNHFDYIYVRYLQNFKLKKRRFNCDEEKEKNFFPETCVTYIVYSFFSILISRCFCRRYIRLGIRFDLSLDRYMYKLRYTQLQFSQRINPCYQFFFSYLGRYVYKWNKRPCLYFELNDSKNTRFFRSRDIFGSVGHLFFSQYSRSK